MLGAYGLLAATTQLLWLTFAPVTTQAASAMGTDVGTVGDLAVAFPFVYIVLALPTGRWLETRFTQALGAGAVVTGLGACIRVLAPTSFTCQLVGQLVISVGQPLVLNAITKVAVRQFPEPERARAISIGTVALFAGILAAVLGGEPLFTWGGLALLVWVQAAIAVAAALGMLLALRVPPAYPEPTTGSASLRWLLHDRFLWRLAVLVLIGMGVYNAVATWLEAILDHFHQGAVAGPLIAVMTVAGIAGAAVLPPLVSARDRRRALLLVALAVTAAAFVLLAVRQEPVWAGAVLFVDGFFVMAALPVVLGWSEVHTGGRRQAEATSFLLLAGNLGGVLLVLLVQPLIGDPYLSLAALAAVAVAGLPVAASLPRHDAADQSAA